MRLYENEAKKVFEKEGIPIPKQFGTISREGYFLDRVNDSEFPVMLKSLALIGGRGKAGGISCRAAQEKQIIIPWRFCALARARRQSQGLTEGSIGRRFSLRDLRRSAL